MKLCSVEGCERNSRARGFCNTHYWHFHIGRTPGSESNKQRSARLRNEAIAAGLSRFETGEPCSRGHISPRWTGGQCIECAKLTTKARYKKDPSKALASSASWVQRNRERMREIVRAWDAANQDKKNEYSAHRRAREKNATPKWANRTEIKKIYAQAKIENMEVDHVVPLQGVNVCGLHVENNLQLLPQFENRSKGNKPIYVSAVKPIVWRDSAAVIV